MPVRELLGRTREVVQSVKPCFMMSPLTVSQMLPADYHFDVVVFDEASQVRPSDAINCIYRGQTLIVAGDDKQLPPTSFFDSAGEEESDEYEADIPDSFESLLHACKAGAMRELPLRWHYRSRHEDLITFSNRSFYRNSMVTFPGGARRGQRRGCRVPGSRRRLRPRRPPGQPGGGGSTLPPGCSTTSTPAPAGPSEWWRSPEAQASAIDPRGAAGPAGPA